MTLKQLCDIRGVECRPLFLIREVCALLHVKRQTVSRWISCGKLHAVKVHGRTRWITQESLAVLVGAEGM